MCGLVATMVMATVWGQSLPARPRLVVGVVIEGLSADQLRLLRGQMCASGFNLLLDKGLVIDNLDFGTTLDGAAATAMLYSGASPAVNGVDHGVVYDNGRRRTRSVYYDQGVRGVYTDRPVSATALQVSTLGDEVRIHSDGVGNVYTIALSPEMAVAMSGHAGTGAVWLNDATGSWASSTYYGDMPTPAQRYNHYKSISSRIDTMSWKPLLPLESYTDLPEHRRKYPFRITFAAKDRDRYKAFAASALANAEVTTLATDFLSNFHLGEDNELDMLNLSYSLAPYPYGKDGDTRALRNDAYLRLDRNLSQLFEAVDKGPGMSNTLIFVTGTPPSSRSRRDDERWRVPYGEFSVRRAQTLLNSYLMAKYGSGEWVNSLANGQIHLNHKLAEHHGIELREMRAEVAAFVSRMSGVTSATSIDNVLQSEQPTCNINRENIALQHSADVYFVVAPGWAMVDGENSTNKIMVERVVAATAPCFILAPDVAPQRITSAVDARALAPTVAGQLRIRSPNAASVPAIALK